MSSDGVDRVMRALTVWDPTAPAPVDRAGVDMHTLVNEARSHRLIGVLAAAVNDRSVTAGDADLEIVARAMTDAMSEVLLLEDVMLDAVGVLEDADIDHRILKGSALAHTVHTDPSLRSFGDTDVLVRSADIDRAVQVLGKAGGRRLVPPLAPDFDRRFSKSVTLGWRRGTELDVHRTLAPGPFGVRIAIEDLWSEPSRFELAGMSVKTFSPELHLLHTAYHAVLGDREVRYGGIRDLALLLAADVDVPEVVALAERWRGQAVLAEAVKLVDGFGGAVGELARWAGTVRVSRRERGYLASYRHQRRFRRQVWPVTRELPWADRIAYFRAVALPARENRAARRPRARGRGTGQGSRN